jgi:hypothetical protein
MKTLTQYGLMAAQPWREFRPKMVAESETTRLKTQMKCGVSP